jgi:hypothetical protein
MVVGYNAGNRSAAADARKDAPHMQELRDRLTALRDRIAHVMVRL